MNTTMLGYFKSVYALWASFLKLCPPELTLWDPVFKHNTILYNLTFVLKWDIIIVFPPLCLCVWKVCEYLRTFVAAWTSVNLNVLVLELGFASSPPSLGLLLQDAPLSDCTDTIDGLDVSEGSYSPAKSIRKVLTAPITFFTPLFDLWDSR